MPAYKPCMAILILYLYSMRTRIFFGLICLLLSLYAQSQLSGDYKKVDRVVASFGPMPSMNVAQIADTISRQFSKKEEKARGFFYWIANNIAIDGKATRANDQKKSDPEVVVQVRKATPLGFAKLFNEMCSMGNIRCLVVDGYVKNSPEDIGNPADEINHSWNVVQLGTSPDEWYYVDVARASGSLDKKQINFTPAFTSNYFFADRALFNLDHYPDNQAWQLGAGPKGLKDFYALPVFTNGSYHYGLKKPSPFLGIIRANIKSAVQFSFIQSGDHPINNINLLIGEGNRQQKTEALVFTDDAGNIRFSYQFKREDSFPVSIQIDGKTVLQYMVEVTE